jgi:hypothetical protein
MYWLISSLTALNCSFALLMFFFSSPESSQKQSILLQNLRSSLTIVETKVLLFSATELRKNEGFLFLRPFESELGLSVVIVLLLFFEMES